MKRTDEVIYDVLTRIIEEEGLTPSNISDEARLVDDLGLKSQHLARILAVLELELDVDPFASGQIPITRIQTVGDLCAIYSEMAQ
jgi:acyl carrier protein